MSVAIASIEASCSGESSWKRRKQSVLASPLADQDDSAALEVEDAGEVAPIRVREVVGLGPDSAAGAAELPVCNHHLDDGVRQVEVPEAPVP
jgi:hypothetical protein